MPNTGKERWTIPRSMVKNRKTSCQWMRFAWFYAHLSYICASTYLCKAYVELSFLSKKCHTKTKSELLGMRIYHKSKSNWWGWQFVLTQAIIKKNVFTITSSLIGIYESSCSYYINFFLPKISHIKWDFQILLNNKQLQHFC